MLRRKHPQNKSGNGASEGSRKMRDKQLCLIVTFYTTAGAIAMERLCAEAHLEGRLIPGAERGNLGLRYVVALRSIFAGRNRIAYCAAYA
jgi:hypothetical protein